jgi:hypothetical protein
LLNLGLVHMKSTSELESFLLNDDANIDQLVFEKMKSLVLHNYKISHVIFSFESQSRRFNEIQVDNSVFLIFYNAMW